MDKHDAPGTAQEARSPCSAGDDKGLGVKLNGILFVASFIVAGFLLTYLVKILFSILD